MPELMHIQADELLLDAFRLGRHVYATGFRPKHAISIWRGGTPIGLGLDEYLRFQGVAVHHTTIATSSYEGIRQQNEVVVKGLEHLVRSVCREDSLLIIDDVYETGKTIRAIVESLRARARRNAPRDIRVATVHHKPEASAYDELPLMTLQEVPADVWIDYPHELADLVDEETGDLSLVREKSEELYGILQGGPYPVEDVRLDGETGAYISANQLVLDSFKLGVNIVRSGFEPDFLVAIWPGGVWSALCIHELYKYVAKVEGRPEVVPDHISVNTAETHLSYRTNIVGLDYLAEHVTHDHKVLIVDTMFRTGRRTGDLVGELKALLRRNLSLDNVRIASVYWNPADDGTWIVPPFRHEPDYYLKRVDRQVIYPASVHRFSNPRSVLETVNPRLAEVLFS